jgi:hypothetical protein
MSTSVIGRQVYTWASRTIDFSRLRGPPRGNFNPHPRFNFGPRPVAPTGAKRSASPDEFGANPRRSFSPQGFVWEMEESSGWKRIEGVGAEYGPDTNQ